MHNRLLILVGPTAVGKTDTAIALAEKLNGEIISADSMQIYKYMNIGTAKPTVEEREGIPHHLMDFVDPDEPFSVAEFQKLAKDKIQDILSRNKLPIIAGGTGLYINSIIYDMDFTQSVGNWELRNKLQEEAERFGNDYIHQKLQEIDEALAARIHPNNVKRVIRAIEIYYETGEKIGDFNHDISINPDYDFLLIGLTRDREELYDRINMRVDLMIEQGLIDEVSQLLEKGYNKNLVAFKGLGYKEIIDFLNGEYDLEEAKKILKRDTRRYAKRQLTWFRRYENIYWYNLSNYISKDKLVNDIIKEFEGHFKLL